MTDGVPDRDPPSADDHAVCVVPADRWKRGGSRLDVDEADLDADRG